jgi:hypothetical protein
MLCLNVENRQHPNMPPAGDSWQAIINKDRCLHIHSLAIKGLLVDFGIRILDTALLELTVSIML